MLELVIAITLSTGIIISLSSFLNASDVQKKAEALRVVNDNINFAMETMTREIRAGSVYSSGQGVASFTFKNVDGSQIVYRLNNKRVEKSVNGGSFLALTAPEVNITNLLFYVDGEGINDHLQPRVRIVLTGTAGEKVKVQTKINLQTTISQRKADS